MVSNRQADGLGHVTRGRNVVADELAVGEEADQFPHRAGLDMVKHVQPAAWRANGGFRLRFCTPLPRTTIIRIWANIAPR